MKTIVLLFMVGILNAQVSTKEAPKQFTVGKVSPMGVFQSELTGYVMGDDTTYMMSLRDGRYTSILELVAIHFKASDKEDIYKAMNGFFATKKETILTIGEQTITLSKGTGNTLVISKHGSGYHTLTEKNLKKLFGK